MRELFGEEQPISFSLDSKLLFRDGTLSDATMGKALEVLARYKREAEARGADGIAAVATEVFRKAPNGPAFLRRVWDELGYVRGRWTFRKGVSIFS